MFPLGNFAQFTICILPVINSLLVSNTFFQTFGFRVSSWDAGIYFSSVPRITLMPFNCIKKWLEYNNEMLLRENPMSRVCGLDESGRGAWAGPLVAVAVILLCSSREIERLAKTKIKDGKLLSPAKRLQLHRALQKVKAEITVEIISTRSINNHGIGWANREIMRRLIKKIEAVKYIVDGNLKITVRGKTDRIQSTVDADSTIPSVILAGIVAKVERDKLMRKLHRRFNAYNWYQNAGYGTKEHRDAILKNNLTYYHRNVFVATGLRKVGSKII